MTSEPVFQAPNPVTARAQARVGQTLRGKWRLDSLLGIGGMAAVYVGTHRNGKRGAVKMMHVESGWNEEARARFLREGYAANRVDHPGAVSVLDDDVADDGSVFLVMELLDGETLEARSVARPGQRLELGEVLAVADDLLDVLAAAHEKGIIHRDIKPENVFFTRRGEVKILDFGIARMREEAGSAKMTEVGAAMGTPAFMPPEQALGKWDIVDARTDLWAVGATMFTLLTGQSVHSAETVQQLMLAAMTKPAPGLCSLRPDLPQEVGQVVDCALAFDQASRWPDARTMQQAVRALRTRFGDAGAPVTRGSLASHPGLPSVEPGRAAVAGASARSTLALSPVEAPRRPRSTAPWIAIASIGLVVVGVVGWLSLGKVKSSDAARIAIEASSHPAASASPSAGLPIVSPEPAATTDVPTSATTLPVAATRPSADSSAVKRVGGAKPAASSTRPADPFSRQH